VLGVDGQLPAGQVGHRDAVPHAVEEQLEALVHHALPQQPLGQAHLGQQVHGALLEQPGADPALDVVAGLPLEHDRVDATQVQQMGEHEAGRAGPDDRDLGPHLFH
jgi:hypothetical protein